MSDTSTAHPEQGRGSRPSSDERGLVERMRVFFRQVVAELRKVIWPTRKELITYTWVVMVFVVAIASVVALMDLAFGRAVIAVFGG